MRYATDRAWCAPHYEKLLCDSALLARVYCEAWEATGRVVFRRVAERTLSYLLEEMRGAEGAFCASQDADAQGEEGAYYLLSRREMLDLLGGEEGKAYCAYYGIGERSLPQRVGHGGGIGTPRIAACNERVRAFRRARMPLARDDKALTGWNAMAVTALARMHAATGEGPWLEAARQTAGFLRERLEGPDGRLYALWKDGEARGDGLLDDYAHTALAALSLYRATLEGPWLKWAVSLARRMLADFSAQDGGFYLTPHGGEALPVRPREVYDGALPSGNAAALEVLAWLASLDVGEGWRDAAQRQAAFLAAMPARRRRSTRRRFRPCSRCCIRCACWTPMRARRPTPRCSARCAGGTTRFSTSRPRRGRRRARYGGCAWKTPACRPFTICRRFCAPCRKKFIFDSSVFAKCSSCVHSSAVG